jgi:hypothetical protein
MAVTNPQLFSHTYPTQLQSVPSHDEAAAPIAQGLCDWLPFHNTSLLHALTDSWIGPVLDFLEFHHTSAKGIPHVHLLYARHSDETPLVRCCIVPPDPDLDDKTKGRHPMVQPVLAIRERNLCWSMPAGGARWRQVNAQSLRRYEQRPGGQSGRSHTQRRPRPTAPAVPHDVEL